MEAAFESRLLLDRETLRNLQQRQDMPSLIHLVLHLAVFAAGIVMVIYVSVSPLLALPLSVAVGAIWTTLFAPFHECTHQMAFSSRRLRRLGSAAP